MCQKCVETYLKLIMDRKKPLDCHELLQIRCPIDGCNQRNAYSNNENKRLDNYIPIEPGCLCVEDWYNGLKNIPNSQDLIDKFAKFSGQRRYGLKGHLTDDDIEFIKYA